MRLQNREWERGALSERKGLNRGLFWLYEGHGPAPYYFRLGLLTFDILTIAYFLWAPFRGDGVSHPIADYAIGAIIALDLAARYYIAEPKIKFWKRFYNWADLIVVISMLAPLFTQKPRLPAFAARGSDHSRLHAAEAVERCVVLPQAP